LRSARRSRFSPREKSLSPFLAEGQAHLAIFDRFELLKEQAWLDIAIVLILFAAIFGHGPFDRVIEDLADLHTRINPHRLDGEHLKRPIAAKADVAESGRHMNEQAEPADRRTPLEHGDEVMRFGPLHRPTEIKTIRIEHQSFGRNGVPAEAV